MVGEGEGRRGGEEAWCRATPEGLEAGEERREGQVEVWRERTGGKGASACCCETGRAEPRRRRGADAGSLRSCETLDWSDQMWAGSTAASGMLLSSIEILKHTNTHSDC